MSEIIETKVVVANTAYFHDGKFKTRPCDEGDWWGESICEKVDLYSEIENINLPEGKYKIVLTVERISD